MSIKLLSTKCKINWERTFFFFFKVPIKTIKPLKI